MGFSRQEHWGGLPCPSPGDLPDSGIEPESSASPTLQADSLPTEPPGKPQMRWLNRNLFSHSSLEGRRLRSRCQQGHAFLEASKAESFLAFSWLPVVPSSLWHFWLIDHFSSVFTCKDVIPWDLFLNSLFLLIRTSVTGLRATLIHSDIILLH